MVQALAKKVESTGLGQQRTFMKIRRMAAMGRFSPFIDGESRLFSVNPEKQADVGYQADC